MWDWTEKYGWVLVFLALFMLGCQVLRFLIGG